METLECMRVDRSHSQGGLNTHCKHIWMGVCTDLFKCWEGLQYHVMFVYLCVRPREILAIRDSKNKQAKAYIKQ